MIEWPSEGLEHNGRFSVVVQGEVFSIFIKEFCVSVGLFKSFVASGGKIPIYHVIGEYYMFSDHSESFNDL